MRIAAVDQGTTSTRVLVIDTNGNHELCHAVEHKQYYPHPEWVVHDAEELLSNIKASLQAAGKIDAIALANQGESCVAWDARSGRALSPVLVWQDNRTQDHIEKLKSEGHETTTLERAGLPLESYFSASKFAWMLEHLPEVQKARKQGVLRLGTTDAFFLDRLAGRFVTDITTASRTSLMNLESGCWDEKLGKLFAVPVDLLPEIVATTAEPDSNVLGSIELAHGTVPVVASIVDQQAALYGSGCRNTGDLKITFGTGAFALAVTGKTAFRKPDQGLLPTVAWKKSHGQAMYALDGGIYTASAAVNWARSLGLFDTIESINSFKGPAMIDSGLVFVPALSGLACPYWDRNARGAWFGLQLDTDKSSLVRAVIESIALRAAEVVSAMGECIELPAAVRIDGGMSKNPYFVQFLADVLNREVHAAMLPEFTASGAAILAAEACAGDGGNEFSAAIDNLSGYNTCLPLTDRSHSLQCFQHAVSLCRQWPQGACGEGDNNGS
ncbi:glycerol kinase [Chromatiales bacterium (ex Bugula neritina AB1)]|nr:glycerol kinase [Chromatiales bacterium (ex Bugula neritina AB1)]